MIELMGAGGAGREAAEPVRQARLLGGEAVEGMPPKDMRTVMQQVASGYRISGAQRSDPVAAAEGQSSVQLPEEGVEAVVAAPQTGSGEPLPDAALIGALRGAAPPPAGHAETPQTSAEGAFPLEQVERWLAEQQQLQTGQTAGSAVRQLVDDEPTDASGGLYGLHRWSSQAGSPSVMAGLVQSVIPGSSEARAPVAAQAAPVQLETLLATVTEDAGLPPNPLRASESASPASLTAAVSQSSAASPVVDVRLPGPEARWGEQMLHALREQVEVQLAQRSQQATIRLDPPELGSLNIQISHEQGKLHVQINVAQADVARLLTLLSERLRHELIGQNFTEVSVGVGSDSQQGRQQREHRGALDEPRIMASRESGAAVTETGQAAASDILISV